MVLSYRCHTYDVGEMTATQQVYKNRDKYSAIIAVRRNNQRELRRLLEKDLIDVDMKFDPEYFYDNRNIEDIPTDAQWTLLHESTYRGSVGIVKLLLEYEADINLTVNTEKLRCTSRDNDNLYYNMNGHTALDIAYDREWEKIISILVDHGAKFSDQLLAERYLVWSRIPTHTSPKVETPQGGRTYRDALMGQ